MLFRRRKDDTAMERFKLAVWPRRNHARSTRYVIKRVMRIPATPHAIAIGVAAGCFASFTPLLGFHFLIAFAIAWMLRGSLIASALGTAVGNPLTFPAIWAATLATGHKMLGKDAANAAGFSELWRQSGFEAVWQPFVKPMLLGALPLGLVAAIICYVLTRAAVVAFQARKKKRCRKAIANDNSTRTMGQGHKSESRDVTLGKKTAP